MPIIPHHTRRCLTRGGRTPTPSDAPIVVRDKGSAGPRFLRSSLNMIPQSADLLKGAALPLVAIISPLALQDPGDDPVQVSEWVDG